MCRAILLGVLLVAGMAGAASPADPPAVMLDLGPVVPTPAPTPEAAMRRRLITTITVQNAAGGQSVISFEATDVAEHGDKKYRTLASARYSLSEESPKLRALRAKIFGEIRALEHDLLDYAQIAGPPKERRPVLSLSPDSGEKEKEKEKDQDK